MGNQQTQGDQFQEADWELVNTAPNLVELWRNRRDHQQHIELHRMQSGDHKDIDNLKDLYIARKNHSRWVAALFFKEDDNDDFCSSRYGAQIYTERIPVRLCDLAAVPFPAALHLYDQALHGYYQFARKLGCFEVHSDFMGLNQRGVFKVWAGTNWSEMGAVRGKVSQEDMVHSIIDQIQHVVDKSSMPVDNPSIRNFIYRTSDKITFENAIEEFKNYVRLTNGGEVPSHVDGLALINDAAFRPTENLIYTDRMVAQYPPLIPQPNNLQGYPVPLSAQEGITTFRRVQNLPNQSINRPPSQFYENAFRPEPQVATRRSPFAPSDSRVQAQLNQNRVAGRPNLTRLGSYEDLKPVGREQFTMFSPQHIVSQPQFVNHTNFVRPSYFSAQPQVQQAPIPIPQQYQVPTSPQGQGQQTIYQNRGQPLQQFAPAPLKLDGPEVQSRNIPVRPAFGSSRAEVTPPATPTMRAQNSIIMQLYTSHDNKAFNPNAPVSETKQFNNNVKRTQSIQQQQGRRFDSATIINEGQPGSIQGIPSGQFQPRFITPTSGNKNYELHLKSIQQVNTQHYWKNENESSYRPSTPHEGYSGSRSPSKLEPSSSFQSSTFNNASFGKSGVQASKYVTISEDDGKSSPDFLKKLKEIGLSNTNAPKKYDFDQEYNYSFKEEKKKTSYVDNYYDSTYDFKYSAPNNLDSYTSKNVQSNFNRYDDFAKKFEADNAGTAEKSYGFSFREEFAKSAESKTGSVLNEYLPSKSQQTLGFKSFQAEPTYKVEFDPEILADLQKYK